jgi:hypothetical protein
MSFLCENYSATAGILLCVSGFGDDGLNFAFVVVSVHFTILCSADVTGCACYTSAFAAVVLLGESSLFAVTAIYGVVLGSGGYPLDITSVILGILIGVFYAALGAESAAFAGSLAALVYAVVVTDITFAFEVAAVVTYVFTNETLGIVEAVLTVFNNGCATAIVLTGVSFCGSGVNYLTGVLVAVLFIGNETTVLTYAVFSAAAFKCVLTLVSAVCTYLVVVPLVGEVVNNRLVTARIGVGVRGCGSGPFAGEVVCAVFVFANSALTVGEVVVTGNLTESTGSEGGIPYVLFSLDLDCIATSIENLVVGVVNVLIFNFFGSMIVGVLCAGGSAASTAGLGNLTVSIGIVVGNRFISSGK